MPEERESVDAKTVKQPVCLVVIDGWGVSPEPGVKGDAIANADHPVMANFAKEYPESCTEISAHGLSVGLPDGLMGNSEVGHLNIGAGRVVYQDIVRIDLSIKKDTLKDQPNLLLAFNNAKNGNGRLHLLGLVSDGGVHSHIDHLLYLLRAAKDAGVPETFVHFFGDGRDTAPSSATKYLEQLLAEMDKLQYGKLADIMGRYYAMDRDKRWERVELAYNGLVCGEGEQTNDAIKCVESRYAKDETDEFLKPIIVDKDGRIESKDTLLFFNFRSDRIRQLSSIFGKVLDPMPFSPKSFPNDLFIVTMNQYNAVFPFPVIFPPQTMTNVLAEWLARCGTMQMHVAETEKYAHVTFFFNGGIEKQFDGEDRELVPSPKVATYDLKPEMSAVEVAEKVAVHLDAKKHDFIMCNFAPPDMVGHTGKYEAAIKGVEATDKGIGIIYEACKKAGYVLVVTADHGNAEKMLADDGETPHTAHTCSRVPLIVASKDYKLIPLKEQVGALCDVAPTVLEIMGLPIPTDEMTGQSLLRH